MESKENMNALDDKLLDLVSGGFSRDPHTQSIGDGKAMCVDKCCPGCLKHFLLYTAEDYKAYDKHMRICSVVNRE